MGYDKEADSSETDSRVFCAVILIMISCLFQFVIKIVVFFTCWLEEFSGLFIESFGDIFCYSALLYAACLSRGSLRKSFPLTIHRLVPMAITAVCVFYVATGITQCLDSVSSFLTSSEPNHIDKLHDARQRPFGYWRPQPVEGDGGKMIQASSWAYSEDDAKARNELIGQMKSWGPDWAEERKEGCSPAMRDFIRVIGAPVEELYANADKAKTTPEVQTDGRNESDAEAKAKLKEKIHNYAGRSRNTLWGAATAVFICFCLQLIATVWAGVLFPKTGSRILWVIFVDKLLDTFFLAVMMVYFILSVVYQDAIQLRRFRSYAFRIFFNGLPAYIGLANSFLLAFVWGRELFKTLPFLEGHAPPEKVVSEVRKVAVASIVGVQPSVFSAIYLKAFFSSTLITAEITLVLFDPNENVTDVDVHIKNLVEQVERVSGIERCIAVAQTKLPNDPGAVPIFSI